MATAPAPPAPAPPLPPHAWEDEDRPPGAESPNQTDQTRDGGLPPAAPDGEPDDNRTGLRRPAGGTPNMPRP